MSGGALEEQPRAEAGFFGKLPAKRDFVSRRLPRAFLDPWDAWLQDALAQSREQLGADWLEHYLVSPVWRFALAPGVCGERAAAGVLMPSVDGIGRYFPLALVALVARSTDAAGLAAASGGWYDRAEALILTALAEETALEQFDAAVAELGLPAPEYQSETASAARLESASAEAVLPLGSAGLAARLGPLGVPGGSLWWTAGSDEVKPALLVCAGLPRSDGFAGLLDGRWETWGWPAAPQAEAEVQ